MYGPGLHFCELLCLLSSGNIPLELLVFIEGHKSLSLAVVLLTLSTVSGKQELFLVPRISSCFPASLSFKSHAPDNRDTMRVSYFPLKGIHKLSLGSKFFKKMTKQIICFH